MNLTNYIQQKFGIDERKFLEVLEMSPGAEGYLLGSLGELLFKEYATSLGYEALRIKEKPIGGNNAKNEDARGDFYIRKLGVTKDEWLVVECKGVKSNSEKRSGFTKNNSCLTLLKKHALTRDEHICSIYQSGKRSYDAAQARWKRLNEGIFPEFTWSEENPGPGIPDLTGLWENEQEINEWLNSFPDELYSEDSYWNLSAPFRLLQTHMPSTRIDPYTKIKSTGPLVTEFNILCIDLFLKTGKHEFVFANSTQLNHQGKSPNHLQQNYTIDILTHKENYKRHELLFPWYSDLDKCIAETHPVARKIDTTQLDGR